VIPWLRPRDPFPPVESALRDPNGLLAAGGDLTPARLLEAYSLGIFPWYSEGDPLLWWSPDPRMVLFLDELRVTRSLSRTIRAARYAVTLDRAFREVMAGCAAPRDGQDGTWITPDVLTAYSTLARLGYAHSVETWAGDELVGGLYGVVIGRMFFGESMFARRTDASKVALVHLVRQLRDWGFELIDCQMSTSHLASLGAREIPRPEFNDRISRLVRQPPIPGPWQLAAGIGENAPVTMSGIDGEPSGRA
jgi:leucyl/phenylalanyl-tRNA--protein transferase